jgi:alpha-mannosidase
VKGATIRFQSGALQASEVNLLEEPIRKMVPEGDTLTFDLRPYEIKTFKLELR